MDNNTGGSKPLSKQTDEKQSVEILFTISRLGYGYTKQETLNIAAGLTARVSLTTKHNRL